MYTTYSLMEWNIHMYIMDSFWIWLSVIVDWEWPKRVQIRTESSIPAPYLEVKVVISFSGQMLQVLCDHLIHMYLYLLVWNCLTMTNLCNQCHVHVDTRLIFFVWTLRKISCSQIKVGLNFIETQEAINFD